MSWRQCLHLPAAGLLVWLSFVALGGSWLSGLRRKSCERCEEAKAPGSIGDTWKQHEFSADEALACLQRTEPPWLYAFGDSLTRGVFFDVISLLNQTEHLTHPGHSANFSAHCTIFEKRPPTNRTKCGGFEYVVLGLGTVLPADSVQRKTSPNLRLTFRLKTFTSDTFDAPSLQVLAAKRPGILLMSFGLWDMQYPPGASPEQGLLSFQQHLGSFLDALQKAFPIEKPRIFWLTLTAVASSKLPAWKRPLLSASMAQRYNKFAEPLLRRSGIEIIDTFSSSEQHPEESKDGVHFPGNISLGFARQLLRALCQ